ncbi:MAG: SusD/RagB family nutrient-binding outer membrane lipoprotein [Bacteroidales bacterium]
METIKKLMFVASFFLGLGFLISCDQGFEELNTNPNALSEPVIENMFSYSIARATFSGGDVVVETLWCGAMMQYYTGLDNVEWTGDKYIEDITEHNARVWNQAYPTYIKNIQEVIQRVEGEPELTNLYAIARIWRVFVFHRMTDIYGDIPYSQANKGFYENKYKPEYDTQSAIYADMLNELDEAAQLLDPAKETFGSGDFIYNGDTAKWKRFANSMMLRLGMRLTKVDLAAAEEYVRKAISGGVMQSYGDIALLEHTDDASINHNGISNFWWVKEMAPSQEGTSRSKITKTFIDELKNNNDPRLPLYSTLWEGNADPSLLPQSSALEVQKGLPTGYDYSTIQEVIPGFGTEELKEFSELNLHRIAHRAAPTIFQSYAEVEFLLSEASLRGWSNTDAAIHYANGVTASMEMATLYPGDMSISETAINDYLTENPFPTGEGVEAQMERIHTEMWINLFNRSAIEAYSNWRRTGYPQLTPTNYNRNITGGTIPRRLIYPESEKIQNTEAYNAAIQRQGPDLYTTRVWWDAE